MVIGVSEVADASMYRTDGDSRFVGNVDKRAKLHDVASETTRQLRLKRVVEQRAFIISWSSNEREPTAY
jgi:hypothetical protein